MPEYRISLFGDLTVHTSPLPSGLLTHCKAQELLGYLLLHRSRPQRRELLADLLWGKRHPQQSRKYLRKSLWQLQAFLATVPGADCQPLLHIEPDWIQIHPDAPVWLDVAEFEAACASADGRAGLDLSAVDFHTLTIATHLYTGDLLEGFYQDWCVLERERYREMYLALMDKLMGYCERHQLFDTGIQFGQSILRHDRAREVTHRRLIRLFYLAGDRVSALRQFEACRRALDEELHVKPDEATQWLLERVSHEQAALGAGETQCAHTVADLEPDWEGPLGRIKELMAIQARIHQQLPHEIEALEAALQARSAAP